MIKRLRVVWRKVWFSALPAIGWLGSQGLAWAQAAGAKGGEPKGDDGAPPYVVPYALVIICVGIGLAIVLNSSKRRERAKPEVYGEPQ